MTPTVPVARFFPATIVHCQIGSNWQKALTNYVVEEKRDLLCVTIFDGNAELCSSPEIAKLLEKEPDLMSGLMKLFEEKAKRDVEEKGKPNIAKSESHQTKLELKSTRLLTLPPLFAPFKDEKKGWTKSNVAEQVTLYINLLGYGIGGDKTFVSSTKHKDSSKPECFPAGRHKVRGSGNWIAR